MNTSINFSTSSFVVSYEKLTRILPSIFSLDNPLAYNASLRWNVLEEHALVVETIIPLSFKALTIASPLIFGRLILIIESTNLSLKGEFITICSYLENSSIISFLNSLWLFFALAILSCDKRSAFAKLTAAATFTVPLLKPFSWPPPKVIL